MHGHGLFNIKQSSFVYSLLNQLILSTTLRLRINEHEDAFKHISWTSSISVFILITFSPDKPLPPLYPSLYDMSPKHSSSPNTALSSINKFKRSTCLFSLWELHQTMNTAQHLKPSNFDTKPDDEPIVQSVCFYKVQVLITIYYHFKSKYYAFHCLSHYLGTNLMLCILNHSWQN